MDDDTLATLSRKAWGGLETLHVVSYFAPEVHEEHKALGLHPGAAYFPSRAAAFGEAGAGLVTATFYVFAPVRIEAALPASWEQVTPEQMVHARRSGITQALARVLGAPDVGEVLEIARAVCAGLSPEGRPLYAAHADLEWPEDDLGALWHAATLVREHRGDGHVAVLLAAGLDPVEASMVGGLRSRLSEFTRKSKGWTGPEYDAAADRLGARGWLDSDGALTDLGAAERQRVEDDTDRLALEGWRSVGVEATARLHELLKPLRGPVVESGMLPRPDPR